MCVAEGRGLERFILSWLPEIEVIVPINLRKKIAEITLNSYGKKAITENLGN
jgi:predicted DNA-binding transcriptional regulator YafY